MKGWWIGCVVTLALVCGGARSVSAAGGIIGGPLLASLKQIAANNFEAYNKKDINALMAGIDTRSPDYEATKKAAEAQFKDLDVTTELVDFVGMGHDDEFAVARIKAKSTGKPGSGFANNTVDAIVLFHQENGQWKMWSEDILGVTITP
jgi:ketosteroid isomerase-like protein